MEDCVKHRYQAQYSELVAQLEQIVLVAKRLPPGLQLVKDNIKENTGHNWSGYMTSTCTCYDAASTFRLGASWASAENQDVANHDDIQEFSHYFLPSRD